MRCLSVVVPLVLVAGPAWAQQGSDPHPKTNYVAVVVGLSQYDHMPDEVELDFARSDAATVAGALQDAAHFDATFLLTDRNATKADISETIREKAAQYLGPNDVFVLYFVGHGIGADLGTPTLLPYDATIEHGNEDGFDVEQLARDIATWTRAGTTVIVTDAIHRNQLDGIWFYGPAADQWPGIGPGTMVVSSSSTSEAAKDGLFGVIFADAISGAADANADHSVSAKELTDYLTTRLTGTGQTPVVAGTFSTEMVVAESVTPGNTAAGAQPTPDMVYGDHDVYAAKFVFRDGSSPTVECRDAPKQPCDSACYVRDFKAGPCTITAVVDGQEVKGVTLAMVPGKYDCGTRADHSIACIPPPMGPQR